MPRRTDLDEFQDSYDAGYDYVCDTWSDMLEVARSEVGGVASDIGCDCPDMAHEGIMDALADMNIALGSDTRRRRVKK